MGVRELPRVDHNERRLCNRLLYSLLVLRIPSSSLHFGSRVLKSKGFIMAKCWTLGKDDPLEVKVVYFLLARNRSCPIQYCRLLLLLFLCGWKARYQLFQRYWVQIYHVWYLKISPYFFVGLHYLWFVLLPRGSWSWRFNDPDICSPRFD